MATGISSDGSGIAKGGAAILSYNAPYTISVNFYHTASLSFNPLIILTNAGGTAYDALQMVGVSTLALYCYDGTSFFGPSVSYTPPLNQWVNYTLVRSSLSLISIYIDGVLALSNTGNMAVRGAGDYEFIGHTSFTASTRANISNVLEWTVALTPEEIVTQTRMYRPVTTVGLRSWTPCFSLDRNKDIFAGINWTEFGSLTNTDGPPLSWGGLLSHTKSPTSTPPKTAPVKSVSAPFPSYQDPRNTWEIIDVWEEGIPYAEKIIWQPGSINRINSVGDVPPVQDLHPIYRIKENGVDIGWVVFWWVDLDKAPADLYGYEKDRDTTEGDTTTPVILTFSASDSTSTFYRFDITSFTSSIPNSYFYVGVDSIQGQAWTADPQPSPFSPLWSEVAPTVTRSIPVTTFATPIQIVLRGYVRAPSLVISSTTITVTGTFPAPINGLNVPATSWLETGSP